MKSQNEELVNCSCHRYLTLCRHLSAQILTWIIVVLVNLPSAAHLVNRVPYGCKKAVFATGKLEPSGTVKEVHAPVGAVVKEIYVKNGQRVNSGERLLSLELTTAKKYQEIKAPVSGSISEVNAHTSGFMVTSSKPILKIISDYLLIAKVLLTKKDIGFVKEGMTVDLRIDILPYSEFGEIKGNLIWIGSDVLPPDQIYNFYRFPAQVRLEQQSVLMNGRKMPLASGMSVTANIKIREQCQSI